MGLLIKEIALTTNGILLDEQAQSLVDAGLHRITVSLDTLRPERFKPASTVDTEEAMLVRVQRDNFSVEEEMNRVRARSKRIGGVVTFLGTARDFSQGRDVSSITFEYYEGMAQKTLRDIRERALQDFDVIEVLILHRHGEITIGENIVLIVVGAEHRADAFKACKWCIDELKQITPIWKREQTPEGEVWVEQHP